MAYSAHPVNNIKCAMCDSLINNGIVRDNSYYCNTTCYQNNMFFTTLSQPTPHHHKVHFGEVSYAPTTSPTHATPTMSRTTPSAHATLTARVDESYCRRDGTCTTCKNTYKVCGTAVEIGDNWFCGKTCSSMHNSSLRMAQFPAPAVMFPFASNMYTMLPLCVNARSGKLYF